MIPRCPVRDGFPSWPSPRGDGRAAGIDKLTIRRNMMDTNWLEMMKDAITRADSRVFYALTDRATEDDYQDGNYIEFNDPIAWSEVVK